MTHTEARLILGLPQTFSDHELKRAYRRAAAANHPDRGGNAERMVLVNKSYEVLSSRGLGFKLEPETEYEAQTHRSRSWASTIHAFHTRRHEHAWEKYVVRVSGVLALTVWIAGLVDSINDFATLRGWIVIGLPLSYVFISVPLRFVVGCGIQVYNFGLKLRDRIGPLGA